mgnify:CR=1 FL=1
MLPSIDFFGDTSGISLCFPIKHPISIAKVSVIVAINTKYSNIITIVLVIAVILIIALIGYFGYDIYRKYYTNKGGTTSQIVLLGRFGLFCFIGGKK